MKKQALSPSIALGGVRLHGGHHHDGDIVSSLQSSSKRGTRITIIGLASNVGLTVTKGIAGWVMNSASLLAEALHSFSGKFETVGSVTVSSLLLAGAVTIGWHSFDLLITALQTSGFLLSDTSAAATAAIESVASTSTPNIEHAQHGHGGVLDPNAAWFALASVIVKEWLYRATVKVGRAERSEVLMANAWHHRSDAYSSGVALVAIVGSYAGLPVLDPIGGLVVSGMLMKKADLIDFHSVRGRKQGRFNHVDLVLRLNPNISMQSADQIREKVRANVRNSCDSIQDVMIYLEDATAVKQQNDFEHNHHHDHEHDDHEHTTTVTTHHNHQH
ncbi:hypothetical protein BDF20DRAFT_826513 [Mycotypha africana]|uniref:uncharacterized protein n=1 Tax=Mycotypha africana TaxID=64632 RepID=UPI0022FFF180|nr:uncharacterized protein BDF20DRAFT_826513 [Mycotypha africana]KAI8970094.1 hypothetical protein BDF20DRAFT_826513 [Mycotypha africana]